jgi:hypothetical protein
MAVYSALLIVYVSLAMCLAAGITYLNSPKHKFITFVFALWILAVQVLGTDMFTISFAKSTGFDLQFNRILLISFVLYLAWSKTKEMIRGERSHSYSFEKLLVLYYFLSLIVFLVHLNGVLTLREFVVVYSGWLTFGVFYFTLKCTVDEGMIKSILQALLLMGVFSAIIAVLQFSFDSNFMRIGIAREAFGGKIRSNGLFVAEYYQGYFLIPATIVAMVYLRSIALKTAVIAVNLVGIVLTFHRMSWIIALLIMVIYSLASRKKKAKPVYIVAALLTVLATGYAMKSSLDTRSSFVLERLLSDTVSGRFRFYEVAIARIQTNWLTGVGNTNTNAYYFDVLRSGQRFDSSGENVANIHNLFLNMGYFFGLPVLLSFCLFIFSMMKHFWKKALDDGKFYFIASGVVFMFICANLTNWFYLNTDVALLMAIVTSMSTRSIEADTITD